MLHKTILSLALAASLFFTVAHAVEPAAAVVGEKLDNGLGNLPPYAQWDRHPELRRFAAPALAQTPRSNPGRHSDNLADARR